MLTNWNLQLRSTRKLILRMFCPGFLFGGFKRGLRKIAENTTIGTYRNPTTLFPQPNPTLLMSPRIPMGQYTPATLAPAVMIPDAAALRLSKYWNTTAEHCTYMRPEPNPYMTPCTTNICHGALVIDRNMYERHAMNPPMATMACDPR
ncbi:hypothetical protein OGAPHI_005761 [Ogataea philodendri]|uniref:Uncharacterized protein n=1 Tax=Ogataea philodendri TaxID=1378263 RepID=A0A9P8T1U4_9ASCO|nr:uncharacterized protein OGAPHI_005761 [Ogataea philodendri]KAH3662509.1 hypothetical protein OGAPHI_005761 [Ogataea philodendri]